jgi:hypothetical protein
MPTLIGAAVETFRIADTLPIRAVAASRVGGREAPVEPAPRVDTLCFSQVYIWAVEVG